MGIKEISKILSRPNLFEFGRLFGLVIINTYDGVHEIVLETTCESKCCLAVRIAFGHISIAKFNASNITELWVGLRIITNCHLSEKLSNVTEHWNTEKSIRDWLFMYFFLVFTNTFGCFRLSSQIYVGNRCFQTLKYEPLLLQLGKIYLVIVGDLLSAWHQAIWALSLDLYMYKGSVYREHFTNRTS